MGKGETDSILLGEELVKIIQTTANHADSYVLSEVSSDQCIGELHENASTTYVVIGLPESSKDILSTSNLDAINTLGPVYQSVEVDPELTVG